MPVSIARQRLRTRATRTFAALSVADYMHFLDGVRGAPAVDAEALVDVLLRFSTLAGDVADLAEAIDVNPLIATPHGLVAVDALVVPLPHHDAPGRRC